MSLREATLPPCTPLSVLLDVHRLSRVRLSPLGRTRGPTRRDDASAAWSRQRDKRSRPLGHRGLCCVLASPSGQDQTAGQNQINPSYRDWGRRRDNSYNCGSRGVCELLAMSQGRAPSDSLPSKQRNGLPLLALGAPEPVNPSGDASNDTFCPPSSESLDDPESVQRDRCKRPAPDSSDDTEIARLLADQMSLRTMKSASAVNSGFNNALSENLYEAKVATALMRKVHSMARSDTVESPVTMQTIKDVIRDVLPECAQWLER